MGLASMRPAGAKFWETMAFLKGVRKTFSNEKTCVARAFKYAELRLLRRILQACMHLANARRSNAFSMAMYMRYTYSFQPRGYSRHATYTSSVRNLRQVPTQAQAPTQSGWPPARTASSTRSFRRPRPFIREPYRWLHLVSAMGVVMPQRYISDPA